MAHLRNLEVSIDLVILLLVCSVHFVRGVNGMCEEPADVTGIKEHLMERLKDEYMADMTLYNIPDYLAQARTKLMTSSYKHRVLETRVYGESKCRRLRRLTNISAANSNLPNRASTCPWYVVLEVDEDRLPKAITKAKCSCKKCFSATERQCLIGNCFKEGRCVEVMTYIPVIKRACVNDVYMYMIDIESVAVGCTCSEPGPKKRRKNIA